MASNIVNLINHSGKDESSNESDLSNVVDVDTELAKFAWMGDGQLRKYYGSTVHAYVCVEKEMGITTPVMKNEYEGWGHGKVPKQI